MKLENASEGVSHHTGLSLATEDVLQCAGLNPSSIAVSDVFLEKRPNCVWRTNLMKAKNMFWRVAIL